MSPARRPRPPWLAVRKELSPRRRFILLLCSFLIPLAIWSTISYCPLVWHPLVLITDAGDASVKGKYDYVAPGQMVKKEVFTARNEELKAAGATLAQGEPSNPVFLPAPHEVGKALYTAFTTKPKRRGDQWLHQSLWHSFQIIFWGFFYSALLGLPLGVLAGAFDFFARITEPFVDFIRYMPAPVFGALAVAILGLKDAPKITIIFIGTFFQMVLIVANTTRQLDGSLIEASQTLGANNRQQLFHVIVPGILPQLYRDMRILIGWAWTYLVVAELIGEKSGITSFLYQQQRYRNFDNVYAGIIIIGVIGLLTDQILAFVGRRLFPWRQDGAAKSFKDILISIGLWKKPVRAVAAECKEAGS